MSRNEYNPSNHNLRERLNWADRGQLVQILEAVGIQSYDHESNDELRDAIVANVDDGTVSDNVLSSIDPNWAD